MKRRNLIHRILAGILCAALVFQNVSVTTYATQGSVQALTELSENEEALSVTESETVSAESSSTAEKSTETAPLEESSSTTEKSTETAPSEESSSTVEESTETAPSEESSSTVEESTETTPSEESSSTVEESTEAASTEESSSVVESETETQTGEGFAQISVNKDALQTAAINNGFYLDPDTNTFIFTYNGDDSVFGELLNTIKTSSNILTVDTNAATEAQLKDKLSFKWQSKNSNGTYSDMPYGDVPVNAGEYTLVISLDQKFGKSDPEKINFEIKKSVLQVYVGVFDKYKQSGITVKEIKDELASGLRVRDSKYNMLDWDTCIKAYTMVVKETTGTEALADDTVLKKGGDYSVDVEAELADSFLLNFELQQCKLIQIRINDLKTTKLTITTNVIENEKDITRIYDGNAIAEPTVTASEDGAAPEIAVEVTVVGEIDEATGKDKVLEVPYDSLEKAWYDADGVQLSTVPVDAGTYFFGLKYTDTEGIYASASAQVKVVIEPKMIVLKPSTDVTEFYVGNLATDATANVVYSLVNTDATAFEGWNKESFWGVSYNNVQKSQSYAPVFKLQMGTTPKTAEGEETATVWSDVTGQITIPSGTDEQGTKTEYRIIFSGKKGLYSKAGIATDIIDINSSSVNSADNNHKVDVSKETIEKLAIAVNVNDAKKANIDVSAIVPEGMQEKNVSTDIKLYTKIYDTASIYAETEAYKKAIVTDEDGNVIADGASDKLIYIWHEMDIKENTGDDGKPVYEIVIGNSIDTTYSISPMDAGLYALEVSYKDIGNKYIAKSEYVYFEIEKQLVKFVPEGSFDVYEGEYMEDFISRIENTIDYKIYRIPNNDLTLANEQLIEIAEFGSEEYRKNDSYKPYEIVWFIMKGDNTDREKANYTRIRYGLYHDEFELLTPYKLGAKMAFTNNENYTDNYDVVIDEKITKKLTCEYSDIFVKPMAENTLVITLDSLKLTKEMLTKVYDGKSFDISEAIANGFITLTDKYTKEVLPITGENAFELNYYFKNSANEVVNTPVNVGEYTLFVSYSGNDYYGPASIEYKENKFKIEPREITVTPVVNETIQAGWLAVYHSDKILNSSKAVVEGYIPEDAEAFAYPDYIYNASAFINNISIKVTTIDNKVYTKNLRTGIEYRAGYNISGLNQNVLKDKNSANYKIISKTVKFKTNKRQDPDIKSINYGSIGYVRSKYTYNESTVTIKPLEGISYYYAINETITDISGNELEPGNYFVIQINKPDEFYVESTTYVLTNSVYKNSIEKAGGYILEEDTFNIVVAFNAKTGSNIRTFDIIWEEGYTDTVKIDFTDAKLEEDVKKAVVPKTLAFNAVKSKMTVGENQQLDVKFTKYLIDDVVCLNYDVVSGKDIVSITDNGYVTALKKGTAIIEVYPVKYDNKGKEIRLDYKKVTKKLTVSDVTAPKLSKPYPYDTSVEVTYTKPADGYRREIYILEGKGLKSAYFETKIAEMNQGAFEGIKTEYVTEYDVAGISSYNAAKNQVTYKVTGLKPNTDYTVYVRNVSAVRTNAQDAFVTSSKSGNVKSFKTTKVQADKFELYFDESQDVVYYENRNVGEVALSKKKIKISARGWYDYGFENNVTDTIALDLPLSKDKQDTYVNPRFSYKILDESVISSYKSEIYTEYYKGWYYAISDIAKADKNGNITLTGSGLITIIAYDNISKTYAEPCTIYITSPVTKLAAKNLTLKTGELADIYDVVSLYDGDTKISNVTDNKFALNMELVSGEGIKLHDYDDYRLIYATEANKTAVVRVSLAANPSVYVNVNIKTKPMDGIKNLKVKNIMDDSAVLSFNHYMYSLDNDMNYMIEIRNGRNELVRSEIMNIYRDEDNDGEPDDYYYFFDAELKKKKFTYAYKITGLVRMSNYKISVYPVCCSETAKASTVKLKTTDVPAWKGALLKKNQYSGSMPITYYNATGDRSIDSGYLTSGKMYTFVSDAFMEDRTGDWRPTDKLTWKSTNKKVGTVKANSGTYTATFKAISAGTTDIEVYSKLRKGVIARYKVFVKAAGSAGDKEFNDYEILDFDPYYEAGVEVVTESNPITISATNYNEYRWVKFEAPAYGEYTFGVTNSNWYSFYKYNPNSKQKYQNVALGGNNTFILSDGESIYIKIHGSFIVTVKGNKHSKLTTKSSVKSTASKYVIFTAPEDNCYTFKASTAGKVASYSVNNVNKGALYFDANNIGLNKGDVVILTLTDIINDYNISVSCREALEISSGLTDIGEIEAASEKWFSFTAAVTGTYEFKVTDATEGINAIFYRSGITDTSSGYAFTEIIESTIPEDEVVSTADTKNYIYNTSLNKGEKIAIKIVNNNEVSGNAKISVSLPIVDTVMEGTAKDVTIEKDGEVWLSFAVDETDAKHTFYITGQNIEATYYKNSVTQQISLYSNSSYKYANKGDVIYIKLKNTSEAEVNASVLIVKQRAEVIKLNEVKEFTVENGKEYLYSFTAPAHGLYSFKSNVIFNEEITATHSLVADKYTYVNSITPGVYNWAPTNPYSTNNFYKEVKLAAGTTVLFAVRATGALTDEEGNSVNTKAKIFVSQVTATELPKEITLQNDSAGTVNWYRFTANADDNYSIRLERKDGDNYVSGLNGLADVKYAFSLSEDFYDIPDQISLSAGETIFLRVAGNNTDKENDVSIKINVAGIESLITEIPASAFELANGETKIYKYVVTKTGRYKLLCQSDTESIVPVITYSEAYNGTENSIVNNNEFLFTTIGKTYYFRVKNTDAENKVMVTLALNEVVAEEITAAGTTVTLKPGETKWYVYNIPESDMYIFDVRNLYSEYKSVSIYKNITDLSGVGNNINLGSMYEKSSNVYLKIDNTQSTDVTINLSVLRWPDEELQLGVTKVIDLKQNNPSVMRFRFTVKEDGYYYFQESSTEKWVSFFNFHVDGKVQQVQPLTPYLRKGQCVYVIAYLNYGTTNPEAYAMFRIDKIQEYTLEEGEELTVSVKPWGLETYINFTTKKAAHYAIGFKDIPEGITVETNYTWYGMEDYYVDYNEDVGDTHCIRVSAVANTSEEITFKVYAEEIKKEVLTEDGAELNVPRYKKAWYTFTAPEDGLYNFTADSVNEEIKYWIFEDIDAYYPSLEGTMPCKEYRLKKNETIGIVVYYLNNKADKSGEKVADNASFKLNVSRTEIKEMPVSGTTAELAANEYSWYSYTAAKTGEYNFSSTNGSITLYQHITDNTALSPNLMLEEGKKIYIKVSNNTSENQSIAVNVKVFEAHAFTMENPAQISFTEAEISNGITYKWLSFTPARAGYYKFTNEAVTGIVNTYYGTSNGSISNEYFVGAGKTVYIKVSANAAASSKISAAKGNTQFDYQILEFNKAKKVTLETDEIEYYEFTAPKNGEYRFYSIDVEATGGGWIEGYLYDDQMNPLEAGSYAGENSNFLLRRKLSEGETVYLKLEQDSYYSSISIEYEIYASLWD